MRNVHDAVLSEKTQLQCNVFTIIVFLKKLSDNKITLTLCVIEFIQPLGHTEVRT